jgi:[acyl-carrier-protein] S-malonyltransferase
MKPAADQLEVALADIKINEFEIPYYTNVTGKIVTDKIDVKRFLVDQVYQSVRWEQNVLAMIEAGVDLFIEIGPGQTLKGLIKKIDRKVKVINVSDQATLDQLVDIMEERI